MRQVVPKELTRSGFGPGTGLDAGGVHVQVWGPGSLGTLSARASEPLRLAVTASYREMFRVQRIL